MPDRVKTISHLESMDNTHFVTLVCPCLDSEKIKTDFLRINVCSRRVFKIRLGRSLSFPIRTKDRCGSCGDPRLLWVAKIRKIGGIDIRIQNGRHYDAKKCDHDGGDNDVQR